jgi:hypothetical protein
MMDTHAAHANKKTCLECKKARPLAFFYLNPRADGDYLNICVVCVKGYRTLFDERPGKARKKGNQARLLPRRMDEKYFSDYLIAVLNAQTRAERKQALAEIPEEFRDLMDKWLTFLGGKRKNPNLGRKHGFKNKMGVS